LPEFVELLIEDGFSPGNIQINYEFFKYFEKGTDLFYFNGSISNRYVIRLKTDLQCTEAIGNAGRLFYVNEVNVEFFLDADICSDRGNWCISRDID
jgi:hypothetical protein